MVESPQYEERGTHQARSRLSVSTKAWTTAASASEVSLDSNRDPSPSAVTHSAYSSSLYKYGEKYHAPQHMAISSYLQRTRSVCNPALTGLQNVAPQLSATIHSNRWARIIWYTSLPQEVSRRCSSVAVEHTCVQKSPRPISYHHQLVLHLLPGALHSEFPDGKSCSQRDRSLQLGLSWD